MTKKLKLTIIDYLDYSPQYYDGLSIEEAAKQAQEAINSGDCEVGEWLSSKLKATVEVVDDTENRK